MKFMDSINNRILQVHGMSSKVDSDVGALPMLQAQADTSLAEKRSMILQLRLKADPQKVSSLLTESYRTLAGLKTEMSLDENIHTTEQLLGLFRGVSCLESFMAQATLDMQMAKEGPTTK